MDQIRRALSTIQSQLARLSVSQRLLIASLAVVVVMTLLVVSMIAGKARMVELPGFSAAEQARAAAFLNGIGISAKIQNGALVVPSESRYIALAQLQQGQQMASDKKLVFEKLAESQNWMLPKSQMDQLANYALQNELAKVISYFPGVESADVFISNPPPSGLGASFRKPSASVTVRARREHPLTQDVADSIADLVAGAASGLAAADVRVTDSSTGRRFRARSSDDLGASGYLETVMKLEKHVQDKISEAVSYIGDVIVTVNAQVDLSRKETASREVLPKGKGTESLVASESTTTSTQTQPGSGGETGVRPNTNLSIGSASASNGSSNQETTETKMETQFGTKETRQFEPSGRPTKINVSIGVPLGYVVQVAKAKKGAAGGGAAGGGAAPAEPTDQEIQAAWGEEKKRIEQSLQPLVDIEASREGQSPGAVIATMIPVLTHSAVGGGGGGGDGVKASGSFGGFGGLGSIAGSGLIKTVGLGALAVVALLMTVMMVRKNSRPEPLPSPEELAGVPPKLETESDLVGEAGEGDTAMAGIEIDDDSLRTKKMLEQVSEFVKKNPGDAASLFNRWLTPES